jgi:hypothetical protein
MWQRASPAARWGLLVGLAALAFAVLNVWWFLTYRHGYPFDIDEAGYTNFGLADYLGLKNGGLNGWWESIQHQGTFAPLAPALTSLLVYVHPGVLNGFLTLTAFMFVLVLATYGIAERLAGPKLGALAALVTATLPGTFAFSREYIFAMPTAALLACAVFALLRSDGMKRRRWAIACGVAIGLMLLARTMAITYVPGVLCAALIVMVIRGRGQGDLAKRTLNLALLVLSAVAVAATWYARNLGSVVDYLTNYGYGKQSQFYGRNHALLSWGRLRSVGEHMVSEDLFLPLATVVLVGLSALAVVAFRRLRSERGGSEALMRLAPSDAVSVSLVFLVGYAGLMSSQNGGDGFTFPLAALLPVLAVLALRQFPPAIKPAIAVLALIALVNTVSTATIWSTASHLRQVSLPGLSESLPVTKGVPKGVFAIRSQLPGPETVFDSQDAQWLEADTRVARLLNGLYGPGEAPPLVAYASRNRSLNPNTVQLATITDYQRAMPLLQMEADPNDSVATYREQLTDPKTGDASVLITMSSTEDDFPPTITQSRAVRAAKQLSFHRIRRLTLPDGRRLYIWRKASAARIPSSPRSAASGSAPGNRPD